jgi:UDP-N-acetylmuramoyl-tripeptide--D-alanyl-D-alanine ligase
MAILPMSGRHNLSNALAAAAVGTAFDMSAGEIAAALKTAVPPKMRGEVLQFAAGFTLIDDSYNSNPRSLLSMVQTMAEASSGPIRLMVVAGEMLELGPDAANLHHQAGIEIGELGVDVLWGVRGLAREIVAGAASVGLKSTAFFDSSEEAATEIVDYIQQGDLILIKGSRGVATDKIVSALKEKFPLIGGDK